MSKEFDLPETNKPKKVLIIATTARTGGNLLACELWRRGQLGAPCEYFNPSFVVPRMARRLEVKDRSAYVEAIVRLRTGANGVFAVKAFINDFLIYRDELIRCVPHAQFYYLRLTRKDVKKQALSLARARITGVWAVTSAEGVGPVTEVTDRDLADAWSLIEKNNNAWESFLAMNCIVPLRLAYEDFDFPGTLHQVETFVGVSKSTIAFRELPVPRLIKQSI